MMSSAGIRPPAKRQKLSLQSFDQMIKVIVGSGEEEVCVSLNKILLSNCSEYFKVASSDLWLRSNQTVTLREEDPEIVSIFLAWVHTKDLTSAEAFIDRFTDEAHPPVVPGSGQEPLPLHADQFEQLVSCYLLGDFLQAPEFQNAVINEMIENAADQSRSSSHIAGCTKSIVERVYGETRAEDKLRLLVRDIFTCEAENGLRDLDKMMEGEEDPMILWQNEVLQEMIYGSFERAVSTQDPQHPLYPAPWSSKGDGPCQRYHQHPGEREGFDCEISFSEY